MTPTETKSLFDDYWAKVDYLADDYKALRLSLADAYFTAVDSLADDYKAQRKALDDARKDKPNDRLEI